MQEDIIRSVGSGRDTLALLPTGGGKSICFQVPAMAMEPPSPTPFPDRGKGEEGGTERPKQRAKSQEAGCMGEVPDGLCLVITPLVALMKDQVMHLRAKGIKAFALYAGQTNKQVQETLDNCQFGHTKFLYVSPERLESERFRQRLKFLPIAMLAVDEAHCISQWGYDFRPSYLKIAEIRSFFPEAPVLALTATATQEVVDDIQEKLLFKEKNVFRKSFVRENLSYVVRQADDKPEMLVHILKSVAGSSVVYVRNRQKTREIAEYLRSQNISAEFFHAGLINAEKDARQQAWMKGECRVMVATNAFGMGIDKADVRTVVHMDLPDTIEAYFQEAGRAGRDGERAYAVLLYNRTDRTKVQKRITDNFPERDFLKRVYEAVGDYYEVAIGFGAERSFAFHLEEFCQQKHLAILPTHAAISLLAQAGYWLYTDEQETPPRVMIRMSREQLYKEQLTEQEEQVVNWLMRQYTGIFTDPAIIREEDLCKALQLKPREATSLLIGLSRNGIIRYIPRAKTPYITYILDRQPLERVSLTEEQYEQKQVRYQKRLMAMLEYAEQTQFCRQQLLVGYFGETTEDACGTCDVCIEAKKQAQ